MRLYVESYPPEQLAQYPDFQEDWKKLQTQQAVESSSMWEEAKKGLAGGVIGLESSAAGLGALGTGALGMTGVRNWMLDVYKRKQQEAQEYAPSVPGVQQAFQSLPAFGQYITSRAAGLVPQIGEAAGFALAGSAVAPGPGTEAGAAAGLFGRAAARSALKKLIERQGLTAVERQQLEDYAAGKILAEALPDKVASVVKRAAKDMGSVSANVANFAALGAGAGYGELSGREGVTEEGARIGALISGAGASVGALIPHQLLKSMFGEGVAPDKIVKWIDTKAARVPKELLVAGSGMGAMEFFNILGEHYADPKLKDKDFSKEEWSRMLNAAATGIIAGAPAAGITALRGGPTEGWRPGRPVAETPPPPTAPEEPPMQPGPPFTPGPPETAPPAEASPPPALTPEEQAALYPKTPQQQQIETEVANAIKEREESVQQQRERDDAQLQKEAQDRERAAGVEEKGVEDGARGGVPEGEGGLGTAAAAAIQALAEVPAENQAALASVGVTPERLAEATPTPPSEKASPEKPAAERKVEEAAPVAAAPVVDTGAATAQEPSYPESPSSRRVTTKALEVMAREDEKIAKEDALRAEMAKKDEEYRAKLKELGPPTAPTAPSWLSKVRNSTDAWQEVQKDAKREFYYQIGTNSNSKNYSKALGMFEAPDGKIVVASIYNNQGPKVFIPIEKAGEGAKWESVIAAGYKPIAHTRLFEPKSPNYIRDVYEVYSKEQWEPIQADLYQRKIKGRGLVQPIAAMTPAERKETGTHEKGGETGITPQGVVTGDLAGRIVGKVIELGGGIPVDSEAAGRWLETTLAVDKSIAKELVRIGGGRNSPKTTDLLAELYRRYEEAYEKFRNSGSVDPAEFRSGIVRALEGLSAEQAVERAKDLELRKESLQYGGELEEPVAAPKVSETELESGVPDVEHLVTVSEGVRDHDPRPETQGRSRAILSEFSGEGKGGAYGALKSLYDAGLFKKDFAREIVAELIKLGDKGIHLVAGGDYFSERLGENAAGRYNFNTDTVHVYEQAFFERMSARAFLHEYTHALTHRAIESGRFTNELRELWNAAYKKARDENRNFYGLHYTYDAGREITAENLHEFIAEAFSSSKFQDFLNRVTSPLDKPQTLWGKFVDFVGKLLGIKNRSALADALRLGGQIASERQPRTATVQVPRSAVETTWHTPTNVSKALAETYNPVTGVVERASLVQDSVEAAMLNIQRSEPLEFLLPAGAPPTLPTVDPSIRMNNEAGINNLIERVRTSAAQAGGVGLNIIRKLHGLHNTETVRQRQINEAQVKGIQGFNPAQGIAALRHEENVDYANLGAASALEKESGTLARHLAAAKAKDPQLKAAQQRLLNEHQAILDNFKDAEFMSGVIKRGAKKLLYEDIRDLERVGKAVGAAFQQFQDIEGKIGQPIDDATVGAMRRLYTGDALQGERLFNFLDQMANDPSIDFTRPASEIRSYIRHAAEMDPTLQRYAQLAADTPDAKALLSTVIAFGKLNQRELTLLQARRMESGTEREQLLQELRDQRKETNEQILAGIKSVAKASKLEEAAKLENRKALRMISRVNRLVEHNDRMIALTEAALPVYRNEIEKLVGKIKQTEDAVFSDGMKVRVPATMDPHPKWDEKTVNLKPTAGPATTPEQLRTWTGQMSAWLKLREQAAQGGDETALGFDYQRVKRQRDEIMHNELYEPMLRETDHTVTGLVMSADGKKIGAIGTPTANLIEQGMNKFAGDTTNYRNQADKQFGYKNSRLLHGVMDVLNDGQSWWQRKKVTTEWFEKNILNSVLGFLERGKPQEGVDLEAARDQWFDKVGPWLLSQEHVRPLIEDRMPKFMKAMREYADSAFTSGQWWVNKVQEGGLMVKDPRLGGQLRKHMPVGLWTFQRKFSDNFRNMVHAMRLAGWAKDEEKGVPGALDAWNQVGALYAQDPTKAQALVAKYMTDTVEKDFAYKLTHVPDESVFETPALDESGTTMSADAAEVARAYDEAGGNLIGMFERLHDLYNGQEARGSYIQSGLLRMASVFHEIDSALKKIEPKGAVQVADIEGMVPNAMIDARQFQHLPADWFDYHKFDRNDNARMAERVSWQANFGRDGKTFAGWYQTAQEETGALVAKLRDALTQAEKMVPSGRKKDIDTAASKILGADTSPMLSQFKTGQDRLRYLRKVEERAPFLDSFLRNLYTLFNRGNQEEGSLRWGIRMSGELASLLVNQPTSAISQLATTLDIMAQWGLSPTTARATARTMQMTAKDIGGSLAQGIGWEFLKANQYEKRFLEMNLNDPEVARRMGDIFVTMTGEEHNRAAKFFRQAKDIQGATVNLVGERARYTPLRPLSPFFQTVVSANRGLFVALSEMADGYVTKGIEYLKANPGVQKLTADMLKLKGQDKISFEKWEADHRRYGLDFTEMVKGALDRMNNGDRTVLTNKELERIYSVGLNVISLESNVATMPLWAFNNSVVRFGLPLLGWSYRRALQVAGLRLDNQERNSLKAASAAMLGMAAVGLGGLGLSLVVDAYSEDVLGKKRNLRGLRIPTTGNDWVGIQERINRVGTFGLWGELINGAVNVGTGQGDNRMLSVDQRVVAMQSFQSIQRAVSAFLNQDFDPDYQHVVRPMISAIGGGGMLQYMQMMNHAFDFDNVESRVVKRINAENYLRVVGRDLGMSIRTGGGGYNTPTPITPWIARMEYAAYANDPAEFREMYQGAIDEAKRAGKPNPADYVKHAFETRHPLRYVFSQVPSEHEYRQVLANLNDQGQESVQDAIRLFNYYGQHIGLTPFLGSKKKDLQRSPVNTVERARALSMAY